MTPATAAAAATGAATRRVLCMNKVRVGQEMRLRGENGFGISPQSLSVFQSDASHV